MLELKKIVVGYSGFDAVSDVSLSLETGQWLMIAGPNGAGKSTLIGAISQSVRYSGEVSVDGKDIAILRPKERAKLMGVLQQSNSVEYAFTVEEIVRMGRYAHGGAFGNPSDEDDEMIRNALDITGMKPLADRKMTELSGGEIQRTFLAQLFAQDPKILVLDEPTNHLDLKFQRQVFSLISDWLGRKDRTVISVVHDLGLAKMFGTKALLLDQGKTVAYGDCKDALSEKNLARAYAMDVGGWMRELLQQWN